MRQNWARHWYTPNGMFFHRREAALANSCSEGTISHRYTNCELVVFNGHQNRSWRGKTYKEIGFYVEDFQERPRIKSPAIPKTKHPKQDTDFRKIHNFSHKIYGDFTCSTRALIDRFPDQNLTFGGLSHIIRGEACGHQGWFITNINRTKDETRSKIHIFYHDTYGEFQCSVNELISQFPNLSKDGLHSIAKGSQLQHRGWIAKDCTKIMTPQRNLKYTYYHQEHGVFTCTRLELISKFPNLSKPSMSSLTTGKTKNYKGWSLVVSL